MTHNLIDVIVASSLFDHVKCKIRILEPGLTAMPGGIPVVRKNLREFCTKTLSC